MNDVRVFTLIVVIALLGSACACLHDCTLMAGGTECTVTEGCPLEEDDDSARNSYTDLPINLHIEPIISGSGVPGQNITWSYDVIQGKPDSFVVVSRSLDNSDNKTCTVYTIYGDLPPNSLFYHNCSTHDGYYHEVYTLPRQNPQTDYLHRVTTTKPQKHNITNTYYWQPPLIEIHNDSCNSVVTVSFDAPPLEYNVPEIWVYLYESSEDNDAITGQSVIVQDLANRTMYFEFEIEHAGYYFFKIYRGPNSGECLCMNNSVCIRCGFTRTDYFYFNDSHPKCFIETDAVTDGMGSQSNSVGIEVIILASLSTIVVIIVAVLCVGKFYNGKPKPMKTMKTMSQEEYVQIMFDISNVNSDERANEVKVPGKAPCVGGVSLYVQPHCTSPEQPVANTQSEVEASQYLANNNPQQAADTQNSSINTDLASVNTQGPHIYDNSSSVAAASNYLSDNNPRTGASSGVRNPSITTEGASAYLASSTTEPIASNYAINLAMHLQLGNASTSQSQLIQLQTIGQSPADVGQPKTNSHITQIITQGSHDILSLDPTVITTSAFPQDETFVFPGGGASRHSLDGVNGLPREGASDSFQDGGSDLTLDVSSVGSDVPDDVTQIPAGGGGQNTDEEDSYRT